MAGKEQGAASNEEGAAAGAQKEVGGVAASQDVQGAPSAAAAPPAAAATDAVLASAKLQGAAATGAAGGPAAAADAAAVLALKRQMEELKRKIAMKERLMKQHKGRDAGRPARAGGALQGKAGAIGKQGAGVTSRAGSTHCKGSGWHNTENWRRQRLLDGLRVNTSVHGAGLLYWCVRKLHVPCQRRLFSVGSHLRVLVPSQVQRKEQSRLWHQGRVRQTPLLVSSLLSDPGWWRLLPQRSQSQRSGRQQRYQLRRRRGQQQQRCQQLPLWRGGLAQAGVCPRTPGHPPQR